MDRFETPLTLAAWQFSPDWQVLPGMAYGTTQPAMLGYCDVQAGRCNRSAWERALAEHFPAQPEDRTAGGDADDDPLALVRSLLFWTGAALRRYKVPAMDAARVWRDPDPAHPRRLQIALPYASAEASRIALHWVSRTALQLLRLQPVLVADVQALGQALQPFQLPGFNTIRFVQAAHALGMPWRGLVPGVMAYGQGRSSRWLESSYTDHTPVLGTRLARDKFRTAQVLRQFGLPAPTHARADSAQQAVQQARRIGYPVVVKPADRDQGQGVSADLRDDAAVLAAFAFAARCSDRILVERHVDGNDYRLTILNGRLIKTILRRAAGVIGDGLHTVAELVERLRNDPTARHAAQLRGHAELELDAEARDLLSQHAMSPQTIPACGSFVPLRRRANVSAGGTPELVLGGIHPDNQRLAERAALALQLDLAGVDLIMPDIAQSWLQTGALVCEVNGQPQLGSSTTPGIYRQVLRELVPTPWRVPVVLAVDAGADLVRQLHALCSQATQQTAGGPAGAGPWGMACAQGVWEGTEQIAPASGNGFAAARVLAASRSVGGAIVAMTADELAQCGLPFDRLRLLLVGAGTTPDAGTRRPLPPGLWRLLLPHVEGAIVCAERHACTLPTDAARPPAVVLRTVHDSDAGLLAAAAPLLSDLFGAAVRTASASTP